MRSRWSAYRPQLEVVVNVRVEDIPDEDIAKYNATRG